MDGAIRRPKSVNAAQIGSTPNRFLCSVINATSVAVEGRAPSQRKSPLPSESHSPAAAHDFLAVTHEAPQHPQTSSPPDDPHQSRPDEPSGVTTHPTRRPSPRPTRSPSTASLNPPGSPAPTPPHAHAPHEAASKTGPSLYPPLRTESPSDPGRFTHGNCPDTVVIIVCAGA